MKNAAGGTSSSQYVSFNNNAPAWPIFQNFLDLQNVYYCYDLRKGLLCYSYGFGFLLTLGMGLVQKAVSYIY